MEEQSPHLPLSFAGLVHSRGLFQHSALPSPPDYLLRLPVSMWGTRSSSVNVPLCMWPHLMPPGGRPVPRALGEGVNDSNLISDSIKTSLNKPYWHTRASWPLPLALSWGGGGEGRGMSSRCSHLPEQLWPDLPLPDLGAPRGALWTEACDSFPGMNTVGHEESLNDFPSTLQNTGRSFHTETCFKISNQSPQPRQRVHATNLRATQHQKVCSHLEMRG